MARTALLWFRQDLRLSDNPALQHLLNEDYVIIPLYIWDDALDAPYASAGGAAQWWLHHSLAMLRDSLESYGSRLILRKGEPSDILTEIADATQASAISWNRCYEPAVIARDKAIKQSLKDAGLEVSSHAASLLFEPWTIQNKSGEAFKVYSPFWRHCLKESEPRSPYDKPEDIPSPGQWPPSDRLDDWQWLPSAPDWAGGLRDAWKPGETAAHRRLQAFLDEQVVDYKEQRDRPDCDSTSRLSPYLHHGEISPHQIWHSARQAYGQADDKATRKAIDKFLSEVGWREFSYHLLYHFPTLPEENFRPEFDDFPWKEDDEALTRWQRGQTGYPIIDAGMRELWHTGWMHNRVRMIVASFLIKDLLLHWRHGEDWFWDTLVDADLANNAASWQWVAGSGADAAPYFRVFNPILQGKKFDPDGVYVKRWVPELDKLPAEHLHAPWEAPEEVLNKVGITLGDIYPMPIVDHAAARDRALTAFEQIKKKKAA